MGVWCGLILDSQQFIRYALTVTTSQHSIGLLGVESNDLSGVEAYLASQ